jgi:hypothetical protein
VTAGDTLVEPLAEVDVNPPGLMLMLAAPVVAQLNVLLAPELMLAGFAAKELIVGFATTGVTVTVAVPVIEPALFVAVSA